MDQITVSATLDQVKDVTRFVNERLDALGCPERARIQLDVAVDEIFSNIAHYAYGSGTGDATVRFAFDAKTRMVSVIFEDTGMAYNPLAKTDPDVTLPAEEREVGGLGIFLVKKTMDAMEYARLNERNIVTIRKKI